MTGRSAGGGKLGHKKKRQRIGSGVVPGAAGGMRRVGETGRSLF